MQCLSLRVLENLLFALFMVSCNESMTKLAFEPTSNPVESIVEINDEQQRPLNAVTVVNSCACSNGVPVSMGNCHAICAENSSDENYGTSLFFDVSLSADITDSKFKDLAGFCRTHVDDDDGRVASCHLEVKNEQNSIVQLLSFDPTPGESSFRIDVNSLRFDETYRITIVEANSGARSNTFQLMLMHDSNNVILPLALMPVSQYTCILNEDDAFKDIHLYFNTETRPEALEQSANETVVCHDLDLYGEEPINSPLLSEKSNVFGMWNKNDPRFYDLNNDGQLEVHTLIEDDLSRRGDLVEPNKIQIFKQFSWISGFVNTSGNLETINSNLGFYMTPFLNENTYTSFCPTQSDYDAYDSSSLMKTLKTIVGVDTEALYMLREEGGCDSILVSESNIRKFWYYYEDEIYKRPLTASEFISKKIKVNWPISEAASPYIKHPNQKTYILERPGDIPNKCAPKFLSESNLFPTHDKRIGCIPRF